MYIVISYKRFAVADPHLQIRGQEGSSRPGNKGGGPIMNKNFAQAFEWYPYTEVTIMSLSSIPPNVIKENKYFFLIFSPATLT